jgi:hypothetical protein
VLAKGAGCRRYGAHSRERQGATGLVRHRLLGDLNDHGALQYGQQFMDADALVRHALLDVDQQARG